MRAQVGACAFVLALVAGGLGLAGEVGSPQPPQPGWVLTLTPDDPGHGGKHGCCPPPEQQFLERIHPVGGWHPYPGGLLHWWPPHCFPCGGAPDDYCRKPLPRVCWPPYPPYYIWGPPEICWPGCGGPQHGQNPH